ncbi:MAG: hypothetical protein MSG64_18955 [Pyrinomonadaceae bacterium MAG19_C2-C3]|nr:hypothetical protein [Pyrinomonadaceae bacterium MAG19_C2-C3]
MKIGTTGIRNGAHAGGEDAVTERGGRVLLARAQESYSYDLDGNLTSDGLWAYRWDAENRLISMESLTGVPAEARQKLEFSYDYMGRRIEKRVFGFNVGTGAYQLQSTTKFVYDGWNVVAELDGNFSLVRSYVWGQDMSGSLQGAGGVGGLLTINEAGQSYQAGYDGNGNLTTLVKAGVNTVAASYEYDAFGNTLKAVGEYAERNAFRFSTKYADGETGLLYYGYRYYQPQVGRWLNKDPMEEEGGVNLYTFNFNSPVYRIDLLGLLPRRHWEKIALDSIAFDDKWDTNSILKRNRKITAAYGQMFKRKPTVYVWSGLAAFASNRAGQSMAVAAHGQGGITGFLLRTTEASTKAINILALGNLRVYRDMMWQHWAYDTGGLGEMTELRNNKELPEYLYQAWCLVHDGEEW